jgi:hypothetical protein
MNRSGTPFPLSTGYPPLRRGEPAAFGALFAVLYAGLALAIALRAPRIYRDLDLAFDADLGFWTIDLARAHGPHLRTRVHPLAVLLFNPFGSLLRSVLAALGVESAARLAAALLCALAGAAAVALFRVLLDRLLVPAPHAMLWALVYGLSASQVFFSAVPESYALSAASLVLVFVVASSTKPLGRTRVLAGVLSFGVTATNLVAVAFARLTALDPREPLRSLLRAGGHLGVVLGVSAGLALVQKAVYPTSEPFFRPSGVIGFYALDAHLEAEPGFWPRRAAAVVSHVLFAGLAPPRLHVDPDAPQGAAVDFAPVALAEPTAVGLTHWSLWVVLLVQAARGLWRRARTTGGRDPVCAALALWLAFQVALHMVFGRSLFLYSAHWVFAVVALAAAGLRERPLTGARTTAWILAALAALQGLGVAGMIRQLLLVFGAR